MMVLGIETSHDTGSVAIIRGDNIIGEILFDSGSKHSRNLISSIEYLIQITDISKNNLEGICVSIGPGSYTSLRIGITTAKTIAYALNLPLICIPTMEVIAFNVITCQNNVCVVVDAKKSELFAALFKSNGEELYRITEDFITSPENLCELIKEKTLIIGNGINLYKSIFEYRLPSLALYAGEYLNIPRASSCALLGLGKFSDYNKVEIADISPLYLRKADAELLI